MAIKYSLAYSFSGDFGARGVASSDLNGDALPDFAVTSPSGNRVNVYLANGDGTFRLGSTLTASGGTILNIAALDGNKDGKVDLITADHSTGGVYFYQSIGGGKFSTPTTLGTVGQAHTLAYADFDKNGYLDIAASGYSSSQVLVVQTASGFIPLSTANLASGGGWARGLTVGDFNRDGNTDVVVTNVNFNNAIIFYGPAFSSSRTLSTGSYPIGAIAGDFNGDGRTDFTTSNYVGQSLSFFLQQTDGSFIRSDVSLKGRPSDFPKVADVDGDGFDEVIVGQSDSYQGVAVVALPTSGTATVEYYATASNVQDVFVNDVNSDGKPDFGAVVTGGIVQYQNLNLGAPTYVITSSAPSVNEGSNVTFTIDTKNVEWGKPISYTLTGISQSDLASGSLTGSATVNQNGVDGRATVIVNLASDQTTEGAEALRLVVGSTTSSAVTINDSSPAPSPQFNSANGHYYEAVISQTQWMQNVLTAGSWQQVKQLAEASTYRGLQGYLATITSQDEQSIVENVVRFANSNSSYIQKLGVNPSDGVDLRGGWYYVGGKESVTTDGSIKNAWQTGPEAGTLVSYANWLIYPNGSRYPSLENGIVDVIGIDAGTLQNPSFSGKWVAFPDGSNSRYTFAEIPKGYVIEYGGLPATYTITPSATSVNEGSSVTFTIDTKNVEWGKPISYTLTGISQSDLASGSLTGSATVNQNGVDGRATVTVALAADQLIEEAETLRITVGTVTSNSVAINDTTPTYVLTPASSSVKEGSVAVFALTTTNVAADTSIPYTISGVAATDITGGIYQNPPLSGSVKVDSNGKGTILIPLAADALNEQTETLTISLGGVSSSVSVIDSTTPPATANVVQNPGDGHWYELVSTSVTWEQALASASTRTYRGLNGYLAAVGSEPENALIRTLFKAGAQGYWLGASDAGNQGRWTWRAGPESGQTAGYTNFLPGEPTGSSGEDYLEVWASVFDGSFSGYWNDNFLNGSGLAGYIVEYGGLPATYTITPSATSVNEGSSVTFTIDTKNVEWGKPISYTLTGISQSDLASGSLTGTATVNQNGVDGRATVTVNLASDQITEGNESLLLTVGSTTSSPITVIDSKISEISIVSNKSAVAEGDSVTFTINAPQKYAGTTLPFAITGISLVDLEWGSLNGVVRFDDTGNTRLSVSLKGDGLIENNEEIKLTIGDFTKTVSIIDSGSSKSPPFNQLIYGTSGDDKINGDGDNDTIYGMDGNDVIGVTGIKNYAYGGDGNDKIYLSNGSSAAYGENGNDYIEVYPNMGQATVTGGLGDDEVFFWPTFPPTATLISGNLGTDTLTIFRKEPTSYKIVLSSADYSTGNYSGAAGTISNSETPTIVFDGIEKINFVSDGGDRAPTENNSLLILNVTEASTGKYYAFVQVESSQPNYWSTKAAGFTWDYAELVASRFWYGDMQGYLAHPTTVGESAYLQSQIARIGPNNDYWIGAKSVGSSWQWIGGPSSEGGKIINEFVNWSKESKLLNGNGAIKNPLEIVGENVIAVSNSETRLNGFIIEFGKEDLGDKSPTFKLISSSTTVSEGMLATFNLFTTNLAQGTSLAYTISGVSASDIVGGVLSGTATIGSNGQATISIPIAADQTTEKSETLTVSVQGQSSSITINDTSKTPEFPGILSIVAAAASVNEGDTAIFNISTSDIPVGTVLTYEISTAQNGGLTLYADATDIKDNKVTGTFTIERGGTATIAIPILADSKTEGTEVLFVTTQGKSALTLINDIPGGDKTPPTIIMTTPTEGQKRVPVDTEIKVTFSEPIQFGAGIITLKDESGSAVDVFNTGLKTDALSIQGSTLTLKPTATLKLYEQYTLYVGNSSIKDLSGNLFAESKPLTFKSATLDGLYHFFVAAFSAAPGATYMDQLADAYNFGLNLKQIVNIFTTKPQFTSVYPESLTNKDFATRLTESIVKTSASSSAKNSAITDIKSALDIGWSRGDVIFTVFGNLVSKPKTDPDWGATSIQFENQLKVSRYLTEDLQYATTDVPLLQRIISTVSAGTDVSTDAKIIEIIGSLPPGG